MERVEGICHFPAEQAVQAAAERARLERKVELLQARSIAPQPSIAEQGGAVASIQPPANLKQALAEAVEDPPATIPLAAQAGGMEAPVANQRALQIIQLAPPTATRRVILVSRICLAAREEAELIEQVVLWELPLQLAAVVVAVQLN